MLAKIRHGVAEDLGAEALGLQMPPEPELNVVRLGVCWQRETDQPRAAVPAAGEGASDPSNVSIVYGTLNGPFPAVASLPRGK